MAIVEALTPAELALQLANPEGDAGLAVGDRLNDTNQAGNRKTVSLLGLTAGHHVLEIGFGNGRTVPDVIRQAADIQYTGVDISATNARGSLSFQCSAGRSRPGQLSPWRG